MKHVLLTAVAMCAPQGLQHDQHLWQMCTGNLGEGPILRGQLRSGLNLAIKPPPCPLNSGSVAFLQAHIGGIGHKYRSLCTMVQWEHMPPSPRARATTQWPITLCATTRSDACASSLAAMLKACASSLAARIEACRSTGIMGVPRPVMCISISLAMGEEGGAI